MRTPPLGTKIIALGVGLLGEEPLGRRIMPRTLACGALAGMAVATKWVALPVLAGMAVLTVLAGDPEDRRSAVIFMPIWLGLPVSPEHLDRRLLFDGWRFPGTA